MTFRPAAFAPLGTAAAFLAGFAAAGDARATGSVLPPPRPAALAASAAGAVSSTRDVLTTGSVLRVAEAGDDGAVALAQARGTPSDREIVERANAALNALTSMSADFTQVGGDGRRSGGVLYVQRPGKLRFEYNKPSTMEVVSDGSTVLVRDRKLNTADPYPIGQTPLKFLTGARTDLARQARVRDVSRDGEGARITLEDSSTLGGTSRITLYFDPEITTLKRWRVVDPQGYTTTVSLSDIETNRAIDPKIFMLNYMRPVD